jgi:hypothetical protein
MKKISLCLTVSALLAATFLLAMSLAAMGGVRWAAEGVGIRIAPNDAGAPQMISDGSGGAIITWHDNRAGVGQLAVYAQRVDASGNPLWTAEGVGVCTMPSSNYAGYPSITSDGSGGAIIAWQDYRDGHNDVYAQRVNASGSVAWAAGGVAIRTSSPGNASRPQVCSDGSGGAFITWDDDRTPSYVDIYAQRVDGAGSVAWGVDGVAIRNLSLNEGRDPRIAADSFGGAIITWADNRDGAWDIYAQQIAGTGVIGWTTADGVPIRNASAGNAASPQIVCDHLGVAVITWQDSRNGKTDIYAQQIAGSGSIGWAADGVGVRTASANSVMSVRMTLDEAAGTVITWADNRSGTKWDIYAQRLDAGGNRLWTADGVGVRTASAHDANSPCIVSDGSGGTLIAWEDRRYGSKYDIYIQRLDSAGLPSWTAEGMGVRTASPGDAAACQMAPDGSGGAIAAWQDKRIGKYDIYAQRISRDDTWYLAEGCTGGDFETWVLVQNPNASDVTVDLTFMTPAGPQPGPTGVTVPASSRTSFNVGGTVIDFSVSTKVVSHGGRVICERAMYGGGRAWGTDSIGTTTPAPLWYLAEGCTGGDFETWVLVQNPNPDVVIVDLNFMTTGGLRPGPQDVSIPPNARISFNAGESVVDYNVSTMVQTHTGNVVCERAMYGNGRTWAHDSVGVIAPAPLWYLAEGCTGGDFETWVLVQNPNAAPVTVDVDYMTPGGLQPGPQGVVIPGNSRQTFNVGESVVDFNVSTMVTSAGGPVICERAMYGGNRTWGTDSIGVSTPAPLWYLAEGCTGGDFETWVLVQNPNAAPVTVDVDYMTPGGLQPGPQDVVIPGNSRQTFNVGGTVIDFNVSTMVQTHAGDVICERAMYGGNRTWAHDSIGYTP